MGAIKASNEVFLQLDANRIALGNGYLLTYLSLTRHGKLPSPQKTTVKLSNEVGFY